MKEQKPQAVSRATEGRESGFRLPPALQRKLMRTHSPAEETQLQQQETQYRENLNQFTQTPVMRLIQRKCAACESEEAQRKEEGKDMEDAFTTDDAFADKLQARSGQGSPLQPAVQQEMESGFGADFSGVRIHTGAEAAQLSRSIQAQAFTHGSDIYFNEGKYAPENSSGKKLLAHELTHTIQQGGVKRKIQRVDDNVDYNKDGLTYTGNPAGNFSADPSDYYKEKASDLAGFTAPNAALTGRWTSNPTEKTAIYAAILPAIPADRGVSNITKTFNIPVNQANPTGKYAVYSVKFWPWTAFPGKYAIDITFVKEDATAGATITSGPADMLTKNKSDVYQEKYSTTGITTNSGGTMKLGTLNGTAGFSALEKAAMLEYTQTYIKNDSLYTNGAQFDTRVWVEDPAGGGRKTLLATINLDPPAAGVVNVTWERIGYEGTDVRNLTGLDVKNIVGYSDNIATPAGMITWLKSRYPNAATGLTGATVEDVAAKFNGLFPPVGDSEAWRTWMDKNYGIKILRSAATIAAIKPPVAEKSAEDRLRAKYTGRSNVNQMGANVKDFTAEEIMFIELSLQRYSPKMLSKLRGLQFIRETQPLDATGALEANTDGTPKWAGEESSPHSTSYNTATNAVISVNQTATVILWDGAFRARDSFRGSSSFVTDSRLNTITHEMAHVIGNAAVWSAGMNLNSVKEVDEKFGAFVTRVGLVAPTKYGKTDESENFAESMMLFNLDPEFLKAHRTKTYNWIEHYSRTGKIPTRAEEDKF